MAEFERIGMYAWKLVYVPVGVCVRVCVCVFVFMFVRVCTIGPSCLSKPSVHDH